MNNKDKQFLKSSLYNYLKIHLKMLNGDSLA